MNQSESQYMLKDAKELLTEIENLYSEYLTQETAPRSLMNKIRNFLLNIESALDYLAFDIFSTYCPKHILPEKLESKRKRVNFPLYDSKSWFDKKINDMFPGLNEDRPDIITIFETHQPFKSPEGLNWLSTFNKLVNNNKHRNLTKQHRKLTSHIKYGQIGGITLVNCTFEGVGTPIMYNGTPIDFVTPSPYDRYFNARTEVEFVFKDINKSVLPTLYDIHTSASEVINDIEKILIER
jgi:hypothetical protein